MKSILKVSVVAMMAVATLASCSKKNVELKSDIDSLSYAFGANVGTMFKANLAQIPGGKEKIDSIIKGFEDGLGKQQAYVFGMSYSANIAGQVEQMTEGQKVNEKIMIEAFKKALQGDTTLLMSEMEQMAYIRSYVSPKKKETQMKNLQDGKDFLSKNEKAAGVQKTASGLQYQVVSEGDGKTKPAVDSQVKVNYKGTIIDGTEFDKGEGVTFGVNQVIPGWTEGLQLMSKGAKYKFFIPSELAYGNQDRGEVIKANSVLIFEVELVDVLPAEKK